MSGCRIHNPRRLMVPLFFDPLCKTNLSLRATTHLHQGASVRDLECEKLVQYPARIALGAGEV